MEVLILYISVTALVGGFYTLLFCAGDKQKWYLTIFYISIAIFLGWLILPYFIIIGFIKAIRDFKKGC